MKRKQYKTSLNASPERVWKTLWGQETYPEWTSAFSEGSKVETDWQEGSKILFLNAENEGMVARIKEKKEPTKMVFEHLGMVDKDGKEDMESEKVKAWNGAEEIYILNAANGTTELTVEIDLDEEYDAYFDEAWPKAFKKLHELATIENEEKQKILIKNTVQASIEKVWRYWTEPEHIKQWNMASSDWHTPTAQNDLRKNGKFSYRMEAKDGSTGFDFEGIYDTIDPQRHIAYTLEDGRKVTVDFYEEGNHTRVEEIFEAEGMHSLEMQKLGWQAILDKFKTHVENN